MAWLSDLTGRAEELLNQLDKGAAQALQKPQPITKSKPAYSLSGEPAEFTDGHPASTSATSYAKFASSASDIGIPTNFADGGQEQKSSGYASSITSSIVSKEHRSGGTPAGAGGSSGAFAGRRDDPDEKLIEYLNDSSPTTSRIATAGQESGSKDKALSRRSSSSSLRSLPLQALNSISTAVSGIAVTGGGLPFVRNENETIPSKRAGYSSQGAVSSYSLADRELSEHRARIADLEKQIQSKDAQLAVLRVKLQEANEQVEVREKKVRNANIEIERLKKDSATIASRSQTTDSLEQSLRQLEDHLEAEKGEAKRAEREYMQKLQKLEGEKQSLTQELISLQRTLTDERLHSRDAIDQLKLAKYNLEANKQEFDEYKQKAQRILQSKEKLIEALKNGVNFGDEASAMQSEMQVQLTELEQERDLLREDLQQAQVLQYNMKAELQELESQLAGEQRSSLETQRSLQEQVQSYQQSASEYREQTDRLKQECQCLQEEMTRQLLTLQGKLQQKDLEIERLTNQVAAKSFAASSDNELETRIRNLTENLIQKQTVIETLQTERHSLKLQLERMEKLYREAESDAVQNASTAIHIGNIEDGLQQRGIPSFLRESPYDTGVTHGLKRAYSSLDTISVKVGVFLRRYPIARVLVFLYMILLHLWVMIVLLTYTPEIHPDGYVPGGSSGGHGSKM